MAESSLSLTYVELMNEVGIYLGYGTDYTNYSPAKVADCERILKSGLRRFYGETDWPFLYPTTAISLLADTGDYDAPDDFQGIRGPITFGDINEGIYTIEQIPEAQIRELRQLHASRKGRPQYVAVRPKSHDGNTGQRHELLFWPTPRSAETGSYQKITRQEALTADNPYPLGGSEHAETIRAVCLAAAERERDDIVGDKEGHYQAQLRISLRRAGDQKSHFLGYNGDRSDRLHTRLRRHDVRELYQVNTVTKL